MTRICVAGGTGQVGREVVFQALAMGLTVSVISRNPPVAGTAGRYDGADYFRADVTTGEGLAEGLAGSAVVIDCLEGKTGKALRGYAGGGARLLGAAEGAGVGKAILLSIISCDQSALGFYKAKAAKERVYGQPPLETVTVRSTQFHSLLAGIFSAGSKIGLVPVVRGARFQTIAPADVAAALLEAASEAPSPERHRMRTIGGPEVNEMTELAGTWKLTTGSRGRTVRLPLPGSMGKYLRDGKNLIPEQRYGNETFGSWLAKHADSL